MSEQWKTVGKDDLTIFGGQCDAKQIPALLAVWPDPDKMSNRIWEYSDAINIESGTLPIDDERLERGRIFGEGGDLTLRRDGEKFRWWFIGPKATKLPQGFTSQDFWDQESDGAAFYEEIHSALLWGKRETKDGVFWEDRVAGADLDYPGIPKLTDAARTEITYCTYSRAGRVEFVWLRELQTHKTFADEEAKSND